MSSACVSLTGEIRVDRTLTDRPRAPASRDKSVAARLLGARWWSQQPRAAGRPMTQAGVVEQSVCWHRPVWSSVRGGPAPGNTTAHRDSLAHVAAWLQLVADESSYCRRRDGRVTREAKLSMALRLPRRWIGHKPRVRVSGRAPCRWGFPSHPVEVNGLRTRRLSPVTCAEAYPAGKHVVSARALTSAAGGLVLDPLQRGRIAAGGGLEDVWAACAVSRSSR
jgi:hypothetical protein